MGIALVTSVFKLKPSLHDPMFAGIEFGDKYKSLLGKEFSIEDFKPVRDEDGNWKYTSLARKWQEVQVVGAVRSFNDYPCHSLSEPAFSHRAVNALKDVLVQDGELLPVQHKVGRFYIYNLRTVAEGLLKATTKYERFPNGDVLRIKWFDFYKRKLQGKTIFRLAERPFEVYVTDEFKERVEAAALNGFHFIKVWPYPRNVDWRDEETKWRKKNSQELKLRGECLILRFRLAGATPTAKEKRLIKKYETELVDLLSNQTSVEDPYFGSFDASESVDGDHRIFISGPDVELLSEFLKGWIDANAWPGAFHMVKRKGHILDRQAKEERIVVK
ncbi:MAG: hypothetical protein Aurels2KO_14990 [Aureliella sp.]